LPEPAPGQVDHAQNESGGGEGRQKKKGDGTTPTWVGREKHIPCGRSSRLEKGTARQREKRGHSTANGKRGQEKGTTIFHAAITRGAGAGEGEGWPGGGIRTQGNQGGKKWVLAKKTTKKGGKRRFLGNQGFSREGLNRRGPETFGKGKTGNGERKGKKRTGGNSCLTGQGKVQGNAGEKYTMTSRGPVEVMRKKPYSAALSGGLGRPSKVREVAKWSEKKENGKSIHRKKKMDKQTRTGKETTKRTEGQKVN